MVPAADTGNPGGCSFNEVPAVNTLTLFIIMCIFVLYVACMPPFTGVSITLSLSLSRGRGRTGTGYWYGYSPVSCKVRRVSADLCASQNANRIYVAVIDHQ